LEYGCAETVCESDDQVPWSTSVFAGTTGFPDWDLEDEYTMEYRTVPAAGSSKLYGGQQGQAALDFLAKAHSILASCHAQFAGNPPVALLMTQLRAMLEQNSAAFIVYSKAQDALQHIVKLATAGKFAEVAAYESADLANAFTAGTTEASKRSALLRLLIQDYVKALSSKQQYVVDRVSRTLVLAPIVAAPSPVPTRVKVTEEDVEKARDSEVAMRDFALEVNNQLREQYARRSADLASRIQEMDRQLPVQMPDFTPVEFVKEAQDAVENARTAMFKVYALYPGLAGKEGRTPASSSGGGSRSGSEWSAVEAADSSGANNEGPGVLTRSQKEKAQAAQEAAQVAQEQAQS
jgi:hypothetical protein